MILRQAPYPMSVRMGEYVVRKGDDYLIYSHSDQFEFSHAKTSAFVWFNWECARSHAEACEGQVYKRFSDGFELAMDNYQHP